ncbi:MAG: DoxX-like family protein [Opitutales bacterium]
MTLSAPRLSRLILGFLWVYQGLVPKLVAFAPLERDIVERSGLYLGSPALTMQYIGVVEILLGVWLLNGWALHAACLITTGLLVGLSIAVVIIEPSLLVGPFSGIIKNVALLALAWIACQPSQEPKGP